MYSSSRIQIHSLLALYHSICLSVHLSCLSYYLSLICVFIIFIFSVPNGEADNVHLSLLWSTNYFVSLLLRK